MTGSEYPQILRPLLCALLQPRETFHVAQLQLPTRSTESLRGRFQGQGLLITFFLSLLPCIGSLALPFFPSILFQPCVISLIARILSCLHWRISSSNHCSSSLTLYFLSFPALPPRSEKPSEPQRRPLPTSTPLCAAGWSTLTARSWPTTPQPSPSTRPR